MQINAIGTDFQAKINSGETLEKTKNAKFKATGNTTIAFKGGNERHLFHQISELGIFGQGAGGVATVGNDLFFNIKDFDRVVENIPLYNQEVVYVKDLDKDGKVQGIKQDGVKIRRIPKNLPADHPFKAYEGCVYTTSLTLNKDVDIATELAKPKNLGKVFILDEIGTSKMAWGLEKEVPIGIYKMRKDDRMLAFLRKKGWTDEMIRKIDITFTYVDATASMAKPYADGSYSSATGDAAARKISANWLGKEYPKEAKATAELLPFLKEKMGGFDPKYVTCHDGQAMPLVHYIAEMNARGLDYYKDKVVTAYGHNLNDGYMYGLGTKDAIVAIAKPGEIEKIVNSKQYKKAILDGKEEEFLKTLLPKEIFDGRKQINAVMFPIAYGEKGFLPMFTTVSNHYYKSIIENELVSPALYKRLRSLSEKGIFNGILNVLMDPLASGFTTDGLQEYYKNDCKIRTKDGKEITIPKFLAFDESKKYDLEEVRRVKQHNKISLLKRLNQDFEGAELWGKTEDGTMKWLDKGSGFSAAVTGGTDRKFKFLGGIDKKYVQMLEKGEDIPMFVSWGRGDFQKGMDTGIEAWAKFVKKTNDKKSVYIFGGDMTQIRDNITKLLEKFEKDPQLKGRFLCLDGWVPGNSLAAAGDYAALASRFAPCELTDLESMKKGCIPIVPKVQGMDQKVFDPNDAEHADFINGYKGKHEYYMSEADALSVASKEEKEKFIELKEKIIKEIKKDYKSKIGEEIPGELLNKQLKDSQKYTDALQKLRDSIISDEMAESMERAIKDRNTDTARRLWKNHVDLKTTWEENGWCNPNKKSTGDLVAEMHYNKACGKNLNKGEELKLDLSKLTSEKTKATNFGNKIKTFLKSKGGKWTLGIAGGTAVAAGLGYVGYKAGWLSPKFEEENKPGHLSCVG